MRVLRTPVPAIRRGAARRSGVGGGKSANAASPSPSRSPCRRARCGTSASTRSGGSTIRRGRGSSPRSEEHTSELQSLMRISYAVFCLKKKTILQHEQNKHHTHNNEITK